MPDECGVAKAVEKVKRIMSHERPDMHDSRPRQLAEPGSPYFMRASGMRRNSPYEPDMRVVYHVLSKSVLVTFRGEVKIMGPFASRDDAVDAAEEFCRSRGWIG